MFYRRLSNQQIQMLIAAALVLLTGSAGLAIALNNGSLRLDQATNPYNRHADLMEKVAAHKTVTALSENRPVPAATLEAPALEGSTGPGPHGGVADTAPQIPLLRIGNQGPSQLTWTMAGVYTGPAAYSRKLNVGVAGREAQALAATLDADPELAERFSFIGLGEEWYPETIQPFDLLLINQADTAISSIEADALAAFHTSGRSVVLALAGADDAGAPIHALLNRIAGVRAARPVTFGAATPGSHPIAGSIPSRTPLGPGVSLRLQDAEPVLQTESGEVYAAAREAGARTVVLGGDLTSWSQANLPLVRAVLAWSGVTWLFVEPQEGAMAGYDQHEIITSLDTSSFLSGTHTARIWIESNDPALPRVIVPMVLYITGEPRAVLDTLRIDFGEVYIGYPRTRQITVHNQGTSDLTVEEITAGAPTLVISPTQFSLAPLERQQVSVTFSPSDVGELNTKLTLTSNSAISPRQRIALAGRALQPPRITVAQIEGGKIQTLTTANAQVEVGVPMVYQSPTATATPRQKPTATPIRTPTATATQPATARPTYTPAPTPTTTPTPSTAEFVH